MMRLLKMIGSVVRLPFIASYIMFRARVILGGIVLGGVLLASILMTIGKFVSELYEFRAGDQAVAHCPGDSFDKSAIVFDALTLCATRGVPQDKLTHAARVAAEWLDNDEDGMADNPLVNEKLKANKATVVMSAAEFLFYSAKIHAALEAEGRFGQHLGAIETNNPARRDASQEKIHHIIVGGGWARAYPELFDERSTDSAVYHAWQKAAAERYYVYETPYCDEACKVMEFIYKSTAAYLGARADLAETEFTLKNQAALRSKLPEIVALYESRQYAYPTLHWPDGSYPHEDQVILYQP